MKRLAEGEAAAVGAGLVALQSFHTVAVMMAGKEPGKGSVKIMTAVVMWEPLSEWSERDNDSMIDQMRLHFLHNF